MADLFNEIEIALDDSPDYPRELTLYRGFKFFPKFQKLRIGDTILLDGFNSMTCDMEVAFEGFGHRDYNATIHVPEGMKSLYLVEYSLHPGEHEFLSYANPIFRFDGFSEERLTWEQFQKSGNTEKNPSYHLTLIGHQEADFEINAEFDYRFLFFLQKLVEKTNSYRPLENWVERYTLAFEHMEDFKHLTNLWGYSQEFAESLGPISHMTQFYQDFLVDLISQFRDVPDFTFEEIVILATGIRNEFNLLPVWLFPKFSRKYYQGNMTSLSLEEFLKLTQEYKFHPRDLQLLPFEIPDQVYLDYRIRPNIRDRMDDSKFIHKMIFGDLIALHQIFDPDDEAYYDEDLDDVIFPDFYDKEIRLWGNVFEKQ